jgi:hypothetical protein
VVWWSKQDEQTLDSALTGSPAVRIPNWPEYLVYVQADAMALSALTAWQALHVHARPKPGSAEFE